jgi:hypothetical protein
VCLDGFARRGHQVGHGQSKAWRALLTAACVVAASAALAQDRPRELSRYIGRWIGEGGGWQVTIEIADIVITPSRSQIRIELSCEEDREPPFRFYGWIVEAKELDLLVRYRRERGPLLRLHGTVPHIALSTVAGTPPCERRADLPLAREPR